MPSTRSPSTRKVRYDAEPMTFRVRHEWPAKPRRLLAAELATCPHCGTLRVTEEGKPTRYIRPVLVEAERDRVDEPPCIELPKRTSAPGRRRDAIGCELSQGARERAVREAVGRAPDSE